MFIFGLFGASKLLTRNPGTMKQPQHKISTGKRLTKPILFGSLIVGLATVFFNRHRFLEDVTELRAQERARTDAKRMEILERRQKQMEELASKKKQTGSD